MIRSLTTSLKMFRGEVGVLCLVLLLSFTAMGGLFPIMPLYLSSLGVTVSQLGFMNSLQPAGEGVASPLWGSQADKRGIGFPLAVYTFGGALALLAFAFNRNIAVFFALMFIRGAISSAVWPAGRGFLGASFPPEKKGLAMAVFGTVAAIGMSLGPLISGYVAEAYGYQATFYLAILLYCMAGFVVVTKLRHAKLGREQPSSDTMTVPRPEPALSRRQFWTYLAILGPIQLIIALVFVDGRPFVPLLAESLPGVEVAEIGKLYSAVGIINLLLLIPIGRLSDRLGRKALIVAGLAISFVGLCGMAYSSTLVQLGIFMAMGGIGRSATNPSMLALLSDITPASLQGRVQGFYVICDDAGFVLGPALGGLVWEAWGAGPTFLMYAGPALIGCVAAAVFIRERDWLRKALPASTFDV